MHKIRTTFIPATDTRGERIRATSPTLGQLTIGYPYEFSGSDCHRYAAEQLISGRTNCHVASFEKSTARGFVFTISMVG